MKPNDGGPAFPIAFQHDMGPDGKKTQDWPGMTLRDYFAVEAMKAIMSSGAAMISAQKGSHVMGVAMRDYISKASYFQADSMISEREK